MYLVHGGTYTRWLKAAQFISDFRPVPLSRYYCFKRIIYDCGDRRVRKLRDCQSQDGNADLLVIVSLSPTFDHMCKGTLSAFSNPKLKIAKSNAVLP